MRWELSPSFPASFKNAAGAVKSRALVNLVCSVEEAKLPQEIEILTSSNGVDTESITEFKDAAKELNEDSIHHAVVDEKAIENFQTQLFHYIILSSIINITKHLTYFDAYILHLTLIQRQPHHHQLYP